MQKKRPISSDMKVYIHKDLWGFIREAKSTLGVKTDSQMVNIIIRQRKQQEDERKRLGRKY